MAVTLIAATTGNDAGAGDSVDVTMSASAQIGDLAICAFHAGTTSAVASEGALIEGVPTPPSGWAHAYSSPADGWIPGSPGSGYHGALVWKIVEAGDPGDTFEFARALACSGQMNAVMSVFRSDADAFRPSDPFLSSTRLYREATGAPATQLVMSVSDPGALAVSCVLATSMSNTWWNQTVPGWTRNAQSNASNVNGVDSHRKVGGVTVRYSYISNNSYLHWEFEFAFVVERPVVSGLTPAAGELPSRKESIVFNISDANGLAAVLLAVKLADRPQTLLAFDGVRMRRPFPGTSRAEVYAPGGVTGKTFTLLPVGGWPAAPVVSWWAIDTLGNDEAGDSDADATDVVVPSITGISPASGEVARDTALSFTVDDDKGLGLVLVAARIHGTNEVWVIYDGTSILAPFTASSSATPSGNGIDFVVVPDDGWPSAVEILAFAVDSGGNVL